MRQDQIDRLQTLAEEIGEVFIEEATPENWNGAGIPLTQLDEKQRGNRYWDKKNAVQTGALLARVLDLRDRDSRSADTKMPDEDAEHEIKKYEKQAKELLKAVSAGAGTR